MRERRLVLLGEGGKIGLEANQKSKEGAPGTGDKRIEVSKLEEVADQTDATTTAKDKGEQSREWNSPRKVDTRLRVIRAVPACSPHRIRWRRTAVPRGFLTRACQQVSHSFATNSLNYR